MRMGPDTYEPEHSRMMGEVDLPRKELTSVKDIELLFVITLTKGQKAGVLEYLEKREFTDMFCLTLTTYFVMYEPSR